MSKNRRSNNKKKRWMHLGQPVKRGWPVFRGIYTWHERIEFELRVERDNPFTCAAFAATWSGAFFHNSRKCRPSTTVKTPRVTKNLISFRGNSSGRKKKKEKRNFFSVEKRKSKSGKKKTEEENVMKCYEKFTWRVLSKCYYFNRKCSVQRLHVITLLHSFWDIWLFLKLFYRFLLILPEQPFLTWLLVIFKVIVFSREREVWFVRSVDRVWITLRGKK